jgi:Ca2+-binding EF-hand superfamily protein
MKKLAIMSAFVAAAWASNFALALAPSPEELFKKWDANSDGKVTLEEFVKGTGGKEEKLKEYFSKMDKNADGVVTLEELQAFLKK